MAHTFSQVLVHFVFSTKGHAALLDAEVKEELIPYLGGAVRDMGGKALAINGPFDHIHVLASMPMTVAMADFMRDLKANSSGWVHRRYPKLAQFAWQRGYGAFSVSESNRKTVQAYIANQEEHHRRVTFKEEFLNLLKRHGIEYDERYLWR